MSTHSLTLALPQYDRPLVYQVQTEVKPIVITPQFNYRDEEVRYVLWHFLSAKDRAKQQKKLPSILLPQTTSQKQIVADLLIHQIENVRPTGVFRRKNPQPLYWPDAVTPFVFEALRTFGYDALRLNAADALTLSKQVTRN